MMATIRYVAEYLGVAKNCQKYRFFAVVLNPHISFGIAFGRPSKTPYSETYFEQERFYRKISMFLSSTLCLKA